jgi:hypothetical protein
VLRLMALRAMKNTTVQRWEGKVQYSIIYVIQSSAASPNQSLRAVKAGFKG